MSYVRGSCGRKTPYEKKYGRKNKEQEEWVLEKTAGDARASRVSDINSILEQFESRSEEGRKCALSNLVRTAQNLEFKEGDLEDNQKLLIQFLTQSIRGSPDEAQCAFSAIEILAVIYGTDDDFFGDLLDPVKSIALTAAPEKLEDEQQAVVGAAMRCLGVLCFFCCDNDDMICDIIKDIDSVVCKEPRNSSQPVVAAAIGAWELIHTVTAFSDEYHNRMVSFFWKHLRSAKSSVDTRVAAGRAIGFFFSRVANSDDTVEKLREWISDIDRLTTIINECAFGTTHPKADRAKEQPLFKLLSDWMVEGNDLPNEVVTINDSKVVFGTWSILARLATVRRIVGSGFLPQLSRNPLLEEVLQFEVPEKEGRRRRSQAEKKYARYCANKADKERTKRMALYRSGSYDVED